MREAIRQCIRDSLDEINATREEKILADVDGEVHFYGDGGVFDSMQLVNFLMIVEERLADQLEITLSIVSEKAISRKVSPFSTASNLLEYLLEEVGQTAPAGSG